MIVTDTDIIDQSIQSIQSILDNTITISGGSNGISWDDFSLTNDVNSNTLLVRGKATFEDDVIIGGKSITQTLEKIAQRLNILSMNPELESRWNELKELGDKYRELEANILSKELLIKNLTRDYNV